MKRRNLLETLLTEGQNVKTVLDTTVSKDLKFIKREKRRIEEEIEDAEEVLTNRLSAPDQIDNSTIEVLYGNVKELKARLKTYKDFEKEFYSDAE